MWYHIICLAFGISTFSWIRLYLCAQKYIIDTTKIAPILYYYVHSFIYNYLPHDWQRILKHAINKTVFFYMKVYLYLHLNSCISNRSNIYNPYQNTSLTTQTICDHLFSDTNLDYTFHVFWFCTWLIYIFLIVYGNFPLNSKILSCWDLL